MLGETVYLITDPEQLPRLVIARIQTLNGGVVWELSSGTETSRHYSKEMSKQKNELLRLTQVVN